MDWLFPCSPQDRARSNEHIEPDRLPVPFNPTRLASWEGGIVDPAGHQFVPGPTVSHAIRSNKLSIEELEVIPENLAHLSKKMAFPRALEHSGLLLGANTRLSPPPLVPHEHTQAPSFSLHKEHGVRQSPAISKPFAAHLPLSPPPHLINPAFIDPAALKVGVNSEVRTPTALQISFRPCSAPGSLAV
jgi:hypothetical protein